MSLQEPCTNQKCFYRQSESLLRSFLVLLTQTVLCCNLISVVHSWHVEPNPTSLVRHHNIVINADALKERKEVVGEGARVFVACGDFNLFSL